MILPLVWGTKSKDTTSHTQAFHCSTEVSEWLSKAIVDSVAKAIVSEWLSKAIVACQHLKAVERSIEFCYAVFILQQQTSEYCAAAHAQNIEKGVGGQKLNQGNVL